MKFFKTLSLFAVTANAMLSAQSPQYVSRLSRWSPPNYFQTPLFPFQSVYRPSTPIVYKTLQQCQLRAAALANQNTFYVNTLQQFFVGLGAVIKQNELGALVRTPIAYPNLPSVLDFVQNVAARTRSPCAEREEANARAALGLRRKLADFRGELTRIAALFGSFAAVEGVEATVREQIVSTGERIAQMQTTINGLANRQSGASKSETVTNLSER